jgi:hypothetical protein
MAISILEFLSFLVKKVSSSSEFKAESLLLFVNKVDWFS